MLLLAEATGVVAPALNAVEDLGVLASTGVPFVGVGLALACDGRSAIVAEGFATPVSIGPQVVPRSSYSHELPGQNEV